MPHYCDCTVVYRSPVIGIDQIQPERAHTTLLLVTRQVECAILISSAIHIYYEEMLRMDLVVICLTQSVVLVLVGASGELH